jgi:hypothetical protein
MVKMNRFDPKDEMFCLDEIPQSQTKHDEEKPNVTPQAADVFAEREGQQIHYN